MLHDQLHLPDGHCQPLADAGQELLNRIAGLTLQQQPTSPVLGVLAFLMRPDLHLGVQQRVGPSRISQRSLAPHQRRISDQSARGWQIHIEAGTLLVTGCPASFPIVQ